jgi:hypothetical protein
MFKKIPLKGIDSTKSSLSEGFFVYLQRETFRRYLFDELPWNTHMIGIVGPRGVGSPHYCPSASKNKWGEGRMDRNR